MSGRRRMGPDRQVQGLRVNGFVNRTWRDGLRRGRYGRPGPTPCDRSAEVNAVDQRLSGTAETRVVVLITQRSRVQIPPPLPSPEALSRTEKGPLSPLQEAYSPASASAAGRSGCAVSVSCTRRSAVSESLVPSAARAANSDTAARPAPDVAIRRSADSWSRLFQRQRPPGREHSGNLSTGREVADHGRNPSDTRKR